MMKTPVQFKPTYSEFDPHSALNQIKGMADWCSIRLVEDVTYQIGARDGKVPMNSSQAERGIMVEAMINGQICYAATSDLSSNGLTSAMKQAASLARASADNKPFAFSEAQRPLAKGKYLSPRQLELDQMSLAELTDFMMKASQKLKVSDKIVSSESAAMITESRYHYVSSNGSDFEQNFIWNGHNYACTAQEGTVSQRRSMNGMLARCSQSGLELYSREKIFAECERIGKQAMELLRAEDCPKETMDLILAPDQMYMQIHESIGHPLELDRILGDERNYAGWSFIKPTDFGKLQYGSKLMNVTFDPTVEGEFASYAFDDCGNPAKREFLIKDGVLQRGLGSLESQARLKTQGVANFRSASWNRAPIDRMANINVEPGSSSFAQMISSVKRGLFVQSNRSWSIDDYRNKFQFGCEYGQLIEDGKITKTIRNPNYRGSTIQFWNSLKMVGGKSEVDVFGSPFCGKGEPSQVIRVGHASPPCLFSQIEVFGGGK
jgi:predicted Zn-dependent protease